MKVLKYRVYRPYPNPVMYYFTLADLVFNTFNKQPLLDYPELLKHAEQFTGLLDKNGLTEIYEGDIISPRGYVIANIHEGENKQGTDLVVTGMGSRSWRDTEQEAIKRGCKYAE